MTLLNRRTFIAGGLAAPLLGCSVSPDRAYSTSLAKYSVRNPHAGYFDHAARRAILQTSNDPVIQKARRRIEQKLPTCRAAMNIPVQDQFIDLPSFYGDRAKWNWAVTPFRDFEDAVSSLAAANLMTGDRSHADCLITLVRQWAESNALSKFGYNQKQSKQGWYQIESTLFAIGFAIAAVRPDIPDREPDIAYINEWLVRVARNHFDKRGEPNGTCCNNHYYRRCVYATIIGIIADDDQLFREGCGAVFSALDHATREGALPLEMKRGELAAHYQNYAVMYLAMIAHLAEQQGYPMFDLEIKGQTLHHLIALNNRIIANPKTVTQFSGTSDISYKYRKDKQYFSWFEMYLARFDNPQMEAWIRDKRALYNRSLGGHMTAYFYAAKPGNSVATKDTRAAPPPQGRFVKVPGTNGDDQAPTYQLKF